MEHAWLDSLSEDWVSQPGSDDADNQLPTQTQSPQQTKSKKRVSPSRIPRRSMGTGSSMPPTSDNSVLNERSASQINMSIPRQRMPSKLSQEVTTARDDVTARSASESTDGSVVHNTVQHQSPSGKNSGETPEWKRRLLQGDMAYGEQRDLFCSAANGLQDMFRPPAEVPEIVAEEEYEEPQYESTMPSSPPPYSRRRASIELAEEVDTLEQEEHELDFPHEVTPSPSPRRLEREITFKPNLDESGFVDTPSNRQGHSRPDDVEIYRDQSCLSASVVGDNTRKTSGLSDTRNESFSAILIGKQSDQQGKVDFAPLEMPTDQLQQKLERLRINQLLWNREDIGDDVGGEDVGSKTVDSAEEFARQGGYVNMQRGGRSHEGSFRYRGLSPGLGVDSSEMLPEESMQASTPKHFPTIRTEASNPFDNEDLPSPSLPRAPFPSPEKRHMRADSNNMVSATSPLKLFGPYDTFTNQTLLRRISQFEEGQSGTSSQRSGSPNPQHATNAPIPTGTRISSGAGSRDLEGYEFSGELSYSADDESRASDYDKENHSPQAFLLRPPSMSLPRREQSPDAESEILVRRRRDKSRSSSINRHHDASSNPTNLRQSVGLAQGAPDADGTPKRDSGSEGKRPRTSPSKDPTPKRRRTLHRSDIAYGRETLAEIDAATQKIQSAVSKSSPGRQSIGFDIAGAQVLASRSILRPRTPSERLRRVSRLQQGDKLSEIQEEGKSSPHIQKRNPLQPGDTPKEEERKPSIRTQDFVDQAAQIMAMIRSQVRPPGLASVEESVVGNENPSPGLSDDLRSDSTREPFSRPPSREGKGSVSRLPQQAADPDLVDRLKKYQEASDMGDIISSSMRSMGLAKDAIRAAQDVERHVLENQKSRSGVPFTTDEGEVISDIPNIRISTNPSYAEDQASPSRDYPSNGSGQLTNQSYPTGSSRGSDSRKIIMPESVSHLIPERVGSMRLDKGNKVWIKSKEPEPAQGPSVPPSDSDDDPFASIPDLSVDLTKEMQNLRLTTARKESANVSPEKREPPASPTPATHSSPRGFVTLSPDGRLDADIASPAKEELQKLQDKQNLDSADIDQHDFAPGSESFLDKDGGPLVKVKRRNITISFSSPVASYIQDVQAEDLDSLDDGEEDSDPAELTGGSPTRNRVYAGVGKSALKNGPFPRHNRTPSRQASPHDPGFLPRPVSRIDEQDEDSTVELPHHDNNQLSIIGETSIVSHKTPDARHTSLSLILNHNQTPGHGALSVRGEDSVLIGQNVGKLSLSPLSEFTLNQSDQSLGFEVSYVMGHRHMETGDGTKKVMSMTIRDLVDKLSKAEPCEPFWEDLTQLELQNAGLASLHMLDEFCGKIVTLDASNNTLGHLDGIPASVRQLKVSQNMLTELTSWDHLYNLQYVDISGNEVSSLSALKNLVHLRSIKADDNHLTSLDGLDCHDGLLSLRARGNQIEELDFASVQFDRLTELDLAGNQITSVRNLELLPELSRLKLSRNRLDSFVVQKTMKSLRQLDVSDNNLTSLDIGNLPGMHTIYADRNSIKQLCGFDRARKLDSLSLREQGGDDAMDLGFLSEAYEIRKLFLSGNYLRTFEPQADFLNLQKIELANCGLQSLPENLGQLMPNLRTLNLNFNALSDLSSLRFIPRLKKLLVAGNRLTDSTAVIDLLTDFPHLVQLDLRDNPVTLGFYAPLQVLVSPKEDGVIDPFVLPEADIEKDAVFSKRLDEATKQRRRLHQLVFVASCRRLRILDGLRIKRHEVLEQDEMFMKLVADGLLPRINDSAVAPAPEQAQDADVNPALFNSQGVELAPEEKSFV